MESTMMGPKIDKSALIIVDMQNDFVHPEGGFAHIAREAPAAGIDMPFLMGTIPYVQRLADAFRAPGRPVGYLPHLGKPHYFAPPFPLWAIRRPSDAPPPSPCQGTLGARTRYSLQPPA